MNFKDFSLKENDSGYTLIIADGIKKVEEAMFPTVWDFAEDKDLQEEFSRITEVYLPDSVTRIERSAFSGFSELVKVRMSENIESIGEEAFRLCQNLTDIEFPEGMLSIEQNAFRDCSSLKEVTIPKSLTVISEFVFSGCNALEKINLHDDITQICTAAFCECSQLREFILPQKVTVLTSGVLSCCFSLEKVKLHDKLTEINFGAFAEDVSLKNIDIPESVLKLGAHAFYHCSGLRLIKLPKHLDKIQSNTFARCVNLSEIQLPEDLQEIGIDAFEGCRNIKKVKLPDKLRFIGSRAFKGCENLESAPLPTSVEVIDEAAFDKCYKLNDVGDYEFKKIKAFTFSGCEHLTLKLAKDGTLSKNIYEDHFDKGPDIIVPVPCSPSFEFEKYQSNGDGCYNLSYSVKENQMIISFDCFALKRDNENMDRIIDFLKTPTYDNLIKVKDPHDKMLLAAAFNEYDKKFVDYTKRYFIQFIRYIAKTDSFYLLDYMLDKKVLSSRTIDKALGCISSRDSAELYVTLMNLKEEMGGYNKKDKRLEL